MSWHCSVEREGVFSLAAYLDGIPLLPAKSTDTPESECCSGSGRATWTPFQSGMTFGRSMGDLFGDGSTSSAEDSPARTSLLLGRVLALPESVRDFGSSIFGSLERLGHGWSLPKTPRTCVPVASAPLCQDLPTWGMTAVGACWALPMLERLTEGSECGFWPTPTAAEGTKIPATANYGQVGLNNHPAIRGLPDRPRMEKSRKQYPTPTAVQRPNEGNMRLFRERVLDGTMEAEEAEMILGKSPMLPHGKLPALPTPTASDWKGPNFSGSGSASTRGLATVVATLGTQETQETQKAALNPAWVEWLMAWPIGWTDCAALGTDRFQEWLQQHSGFCRTD